MKIYTRIALLALAVLLTAIPVFAAGAAAGGAAQQTQQATDRMTSLRVMQYSLSNQQTDFANLWFYRELERETGVRVTWDIVRDTDWNTQVNLRMASLNLPDLFRSGSVDPEEYGVTQRLIVPISDHNLQANMPNYYARLQMNESGKPMYASDGKLYYVGYLEAQNINHIGNHYINKTWLDRLGLQVPTTVDQLTAVLTAFRDRAPGGTGTLPMSAGGDEGFFTDRTQGLGPHFAMFGVPFHEDKGIGLGSYAAINGNRVQFITDYPGFRPAMEWFAMAYRERLLDMESLTQDASAWAVKVNAGRVGFFSYLRLINSALTADTAANFISIIPPAATGQRVQVPRLMEVAEQTRGATISSTNRYITQTMQWLDRQLESEKMFVGLYGNISASTGALTPPPLTRTADGKFSVVYTPENNGLYSIVPVWHGMFFAPGDYIFANWDFSSAPHRVERYNTSQDYARAGVLEAGSFTILRSLIKPNNADSIELTRLLADINRLMQESMAAMIRDGVTNANWNTFTSQLNSVGAPRYVQLLQRYYDVYAASAR